jgi:hypothetical protein
MQDFINSMAESWDVNWDHISRHSDGFLQPVSASPGTPPCRIPCQDSRERLYWALPLQQFHPDSPPRSPNSHHPHVPQPSTPSISNTHRVPYTARNAFVCRRTPPPLVPYSSSHPASPVPSTPSTADTDPWEATLPPYRSPGLSQDRAPCPLHASMPPSAAAPLHHVTLDIPPSTPSAPRHYYMPRARRPLHHVNPPSEGVRNSSSGLESARVRTATRSDRLPAVQGRGLERSVYNPYISDQIPEYIPSSLFRDPTLELSTASGVTDLSSPSTSSLSASRVYEELLQPSSRQMTAPPALPIRGTLLSLLQDPQGVRNDIESLSEGIARTGERLERISRRLSRVSGSMPPRALDHQGFATRRVRYERETVRRVLPRLFPPLVQPDHAIAAYDGRGLNEGESICSYSSTLGRLNTSPSSLGSSESLSLCDWEFPDSPVWAAERRALPYQPTINSADFLPAAVRSTLEALESRGGREAPRRGTSSDVHASQVPLSRAAPLASLEPSATMMTGEDYSIQLDEGNWNSFSERRQNSRRRRQLRISIPSQTPSQDLEDAYNGSPAGVLAEKPLCLLHFMQCCTAHVLPGATVDC